MDQLFDTCYLALTHAENLGWNPGLTNTMVKAEGGQHQQNK